MLFRSDHDKNSPCIGRYTVCKWYYRYDSPSFFLEILTAGYTINIKPEKANKAHPTPILSARNPRSGEKTPIKIVFNWDSTERPVESFSDGMISLIKETFNGLLKFCSTKMSRNRITGRKFIEKTLNKPANRISPIPAMKHPLGNRGIRSHQLCRHGSPDVGRPGEISAWRSACGVDVGMISRSL